MMISYLLCILFSSILYICRGKPSINNQEIKVENVTLDNHIFFPNHIRKENFRKDSTGKLIRNGRLDQLGGLSSFTLSRDGKWVEDISKKVYYKDFKSILQCPPLEPGINSNGIVSMIKNLYPISPAIIEYSCAFAENSKLCTDGWGRFDWQRCDEFVKELKSGHVKIDKIRDKNTNVRLIRVMNGKLYFDWPWHSSQSTLYHNVWGFLRLLGGALEKIKDIPDSVFLITIFDFPLLPPNFPMLSLSHGPKVSNSDIPFPWTLLINDEIMHYLKHITKIPNNYTVDDLHSDFQNKDINIKLDGRNNTLWNSRINKAVHYGTLWFTKESVSRQIILELSKKYPDYIVAKWSKNIGASAFIPNEGGMSDISSGSSQDFSEQSYLNSIHDLKLDKEISLIDYMSQYKYLIVLSGMSSSERLSTFLTYSGAVILLQQTDIVYHFTPRLKPWVHYVPLSYSAGDIIEKINWLRDHDQMARQIAKNGQIFGRSYLRLEDYYCYAASLLDTFGRLAQPSALLHFNSTIIPPILKS